MRRPSRRGQRRNANDDGQMARWPCTSSAFSVIADQQISYQPQQGFGMVRASPTSWSAALLGLTFTCTSSSSAFAPPHTPHPHPQVRVLSHRCRRPLRHHHAASAVSVGKHKCVVGANRRPTCCSLTSDTANIITNEHHQQPRLARYLERILRLALQHLFLRRCAALTVRVGASSNRALIRGKLDDFSMSGRDCISRFGLLSVARVDVAGRDLTFGYVPVVLPVLPFFIWRLVSMGYVYIWTMMIGVLLLRRSSQLDEGPPLLIPEQLRRIAGQLCHALGARTSTLNCSLVVSDEDVTQSILWRFGLKRVLRSIVLNSPFVSAAAALGDAQTSVLQDIKRQQRSSQQRNVPLLPSGNAAGDDNDNSSNVRTASIDAGSRSQNLPKSSSSQQQEGMLTTALLSATSFALKGASFSNGRITLDAYAVTPPGKRESAGNRKKHFAFTIRAKIEPLDNERQQRPSSSSRSSAQEQRCDTLLGFVDPEVRMCTTPLTGNNSLLSKFIPNFIWIPFGPGVAVPLGKHNEIYRAEASEDDVGTGGNGVCRLDGSVSLFVPPTPKKRDGTGTLARINPQNGAGG